VRGQQVIQPLPHPCKRLKRRKSVFVVHRRSSRHFHIKQIPLFIHAQGSLRTAVLSIDFCVAFKIVSLTAHQ